MTLVSLNPEGYQLQQKERDILSVFKQHSSKSNEIQKGMTPNEIAEIVSEHFIDVVKQQFEHTKKEFQAKAK